MTTDLFTQPIRLSLCANLSDTLYMHSLILMPLASNGANECEYLIDYACKVRTKEGFKLLIGKFHSPQIFVMSKHLPSFSFNYLTTTP